MRTLTHANAVKIDGTSDTPEAIATWKKYAPDAYHIAKDLHNKVMRW